MPASEYSGRYASASRHLDGRTRVRNAAVVEIVVRRLALLAVAALMPFVAVAGDPWRVVVLPGADPTQPAFIQLDRAFRQALRAAAPDGVEFFTDPLDNMRFRGADLTPDLLALLTKKYSRQKIDLVVGMADYALDFTERHHAQVWPAAQVLIYGLDAALLRERKAPQEFAYLPWQLEYDNTLSIAEALQPQARRLVVIGDDTAQGRREVASAADAGRKRPGGRWAVELWPVLPMEELRSRLAALDGGTAVLYTLLNRDGQGRTYFPVEALRNMVAVSGAPIYGVYPTYIEAGLTAGSVLDFDAIGARAAAQAAALLTHGATAAGPAPAPASHCAANLPRLQAAGLSADALPAGCTLAFAPPSLWREHRVAMLGFLAALLIQAALIAALLWHRRRRRIAENEAIRRGIELARGARLAAMGELSASIAHEISQPLGAILSNADAAELLLHSAQPDLPQLLEILSDIRSDDLRAHEVIRRLRALLRQQQVEHAPLDLHDALHEALHLLAPELRAQGVRIETGFAASGSQLVGDRIQMQQVVMNLVRNAADAMNDIPAALKTVAVSTIDAAGGVELCVADAGHGIRHEHRAELFESFFTTKPQGMGMGLSIVRSIVLAHGGTVQAEARAAGGAVFRVWLPQLAPATGPGGAAQGAA